MGGGQERELGDAQGLCTLSAARCVGGCGRSCPAPARSSGARMCSLATTLSARPSFRRRRTTDSKPAAGSAAAGAWEAGGHPTAAARWQPGGQAAQAAAPLPQCLHCFPLPVLTFCVVVTQHAAGHVERHIGSKAGAPHRVQVALQGRLHGRSWVGGTVARGWQRQRLGVRAAARGGRVQGQAQASVCRCGARSTLVEAASSGRLRGWPLGARAAAAPGCSACCGGAGAGWPPMAPGT